VRAAGRNGKSVSGILSRIFEKNTIQKTCSKTMLKNMSKKRLTLDQMVVKINLTAQILKGKN